MIAPAHENTKPSPSTCVSKKPALPVKSVSNMYWSTSSIDPSTVASPKGETSTTIS